MRLGTQKKEEREGIEEVGTFRQPGNEGAGPREKD